MNTRGHLPGLICLLCSITHTLSYQYFQQRIPNGEVVPHPCKPGHIWRGVGHENHLGGGVRNVFGIDFDNNNKIWNRTICMKDSDGDGKTNGVELGDPDCTWTPGQAPKYSVGLSHTGVCDPFDGPECSGRPDFVNCDDAELKCPAINEEATINVTVNFPVTTVPENETTYICMNFEFPTDQDYHLVATTPALDNRDIMHHILAYGCTASDASQLSKEMNTPYICGMAVDKHCQDLIGLWAVGAAGVCYHHKAGFLVGGSRGYRFGALQMHWNNPLLRNDYTDGSGMSFFMTPNLRPNNAGVLMMGQAVLEIPPGRSAHSATGSCSGQCTQDAMTDDIFVTSGINHMHYLGSAQETELMRNGEHVAYLAVDKVYNYDAPVAYDHANEIRVTSGDEIKTTCVFKSTSRTYTTYYGEATSAEMCFVFLTYYPKENMNAATCIQSRSIDLCDRVDGVVQGCDYGIFTNPAHPQLAAIIGNVTTKCSTSFCTQECLDYVRRTKKHPCFNGDVFKELKEGAFKQEGDALKDMYYFYTALDSCDVELTRESCEIGPTSGANIMKPFTLLITLFVIGYNF